MTNPMTEERPDIDPFVAQQPIDLLDPMLAQRAHRLGQSLANRMHRQRRTGKHSQGRIGQRQNSLGVQVAVIQAGNKFHYLVMPHHLFQFHRALPGDSEARF